MKCSWVKCSEGLSNRVSAFIRRYIYIYIYIYIHIHTYIHTHIHISCKVCWLYGCFSYRILSYSSGSILYYRIYGCMFCRLLFNFVNYVFFLLRLCTLIMFMYSYCYVCSVLCIPFHCVVLCIVCV